MPSLRTYLATVDFRSGGDEMTMVLAENENDAEALLRSLFSRDKDFEGVRIEEEIRTFCATVKLPRGKSVTAGIQAKNPISAKRLLEAIYGDRIKGMVRET